MHISICYISGMHRARSFSSSTLQWIGSQNVVKSVPGLTSLLSACES